MRKLNRIRIKAALAAILVIAASGIAGSTSPEPMNTTFVKAEDSLRVKTIFTGMHRLATLLQDSIIPKLSGDEQKKITQLADSFKTTLSKSETVLIQDTLVSNFSKLGDSKKSAIRNLEKSVSKIKNALSEKSLAYHIVTLEYIPLYKARQDLNPNSKIPYLATYRQAYNPNVVDNNQVIILGAYLNFYLEYKITVGGIEMGPDIVDEGRLVFTFPEKLLADITEPTYVEVKASPKKQTVVGTSSKFEDNPEQHAYVLVYPLKKK